MGEMIVRQPNGLLARFSTVTDSFTEMDLSPEGALEAITQDQIDHLLQSARRAVRAGIEDWIPHTVGRKGDGLARWRHCLALIEQVHGKAAAQEVCATGEKTARSPVKWAGQDRLIFLCDDAQPGRSCAMFVPAAYDAGYALAQTGYDSPRIYNEMAVPFSPFGYYVPLLPAS